ncbi:MAG TPA: hypothetical protein VND43_09015 [Burkholderiales bacterium]|nr:hypothetical protein [Burkholderiales bacterium]
MNTTGQVGEVRHLPETSARHGGRVTGEGRLDDGWQDMAICAREGVAAMES